MAAPADLLKKWEHGTRACYVGSKCRCDLCRKANRTYANAHYRKAVEAALAAPATPGGPKTKQKNHKKRRYQTMCPGVHGTPCPHRAHLRKDSKGGLCATCCMKLIWNGLVPAQRAREHLLALSAKNIGKRAIAAACDVAKTVLSEIKSGQKTQIRADTERRILSVDASAIGDHALVPAAETWGVINRLLKEHGFTKGEVAQALGCKTPALQLKRDFVLASTALRVQKLYQRTVENETEYDRSICPACRVHHEYGEVVRLTRSTPAMRLRALPALLPNTTTVLRQKLNCVYGEDDNSKSKLSRDLRTLGAVGTVKEIDGERETVWSIPDHQERPRTHKPERGREPGRHGLLAPEVQAGRRAAPQRAEGVAREERPQGVHRDVGLHDGPQRSDPQHLGQPLPRGGPATVGLGDARGDRGDPKQHPEVLQREATDQDGHEEGHAAASA